MKTALLAVAALAVVGGGLAVALGPAELGLGSSKSDVYVQVEDDPSWLGYLPADTEDQFSVASLTESEVGGAVVRRVDLVEDGSDSVVSLCFAPTMELLEEACPTWQRLGKTTRDIDAPWVSQLGSNDLGLLRLLNAPELSLDEADLLDS